MICEISYILCFVWCVEYPLCFMICCISFVLYDMMHSLCVVSYFVYNLCNMTYPLCSLTCCMYSVSYNMVHILSIVLYVYMITVISYILSVVWCVVYPLSFMLCCISSVSTQYINMITAELYTVVLPEGAVSIISQICAERVEQCIHRYLFAPYTGLFSYLNFETVKNYGETPIFPLTDSSTKKTPNDCLYAIIISLVPWRDSQGVGLICPPSSCYKTWAIWDA